MTAADKLAEALREASWHLPDGTKADRMAQAALAAYEQEKADMGNPISEPNQHVAREQEKAAEIPAGFRPFSELLAELESDPDMKNRIAAARERLKPLFDAICEQPTHEGPTPFGGRK